MHKWAINILSNATKQNARRRNRIFKYFNTEVSAKVFKPNEVDLEKGLRHKYIDIESQVILYDPPRDEEEEEEEYEPIDWHM